jgi:hypothetical protein
MMQAMQRVLAPRRSQLAARPPAADEVRGLPLPKMPEGAILTAQQPGIRGMSDEQHFLAILVAFVPLGLRSRACSFLHRAARRNLWTTKYRVSRSGVGRMDHRMLRIGGNCRCPPDRPVDISWPAKAGWEGRDRNSPPSLSKVVHTRLIWRSALRPHDGAVA